MRIWIDTDIGSDVDDALALAYVLRHPDLELVGLSTVFGDLDVRTEIAEKLLAIADADPLPVMTGLGVPLTDRKRGVMFGHEGAGLLDNPSPRLRVAEESGGDTRIEELASAVAGAEPDVIVAIGPLTNLGALVRAGVDLPPLAIMGGKLTDVMLEGMVAEIPEWNWFCDPLAVQLVLGADHGQAPLVVPGDVTFRTRLADGDVEELSSGDELCQALATLCGHWLDLQRDAFGRDQPRVALHDPLTVALLAEPTLCPVEARSIVVDDGAASTHVEDGAAITAAVDVDVEGLRRHLMDCWLGRS